MLRPGGPTQLCYYKILVYVCLWWGWGGHARAKAEPEVKYHLNGVELGKVVPWTDHLMGYLEEWGEELPPKFACVPDPV